MYQQKHSIHVLISLKIAVIFLLVGLGMVLYIHKTLRDRTLFDAQIRANIILNQNIAIHTFSTHQFKPRLFDHIDPDKYFNPVLMSSPYAVREINTYFNLLQNDDYYYKEYAVDARNPDNEADEIDRAFLDGFNKGGVSDVYSGIRAIDGVRYYVFMKKGESMNEIKTVQEIIPICMYCKKIRPEGGFWNQLEQYISQHSNTLLSHGICPDCLAKVRRGEME